MKKIYSFLAVAMLAVALVACGGEEKKEGSNVDQLIEECKEAMEKDDYDALEKLHKEYDKLSDADKKKFDKAMEDYM